MKVIAILALCVVGTLATPTAYGGYSHHQPDIRIESYTNAPPVAPADVPMNNGYYQPMAPPTTSAPLADVPMNNGYYHQQQQPEIRIESYTNAPPAIPADVPMNNYYQPMAPPTTSAPPADVPMNNGYYHHQQPEIRIESYTNAPPVAPADVPMNNGYYHYQPPMTTTTVAPTTQAPANPPMQPSYGYYPSQPMATAAPPPADTPIQSSYGSYSTSQSSFKSASAPSATIIRHHHVSDNQGNYRMNVESSDGSSQVETGSLKNLGNPEGPTGVKEGSFSWTSPEGQRFSLSYTADERGFVPKADHLPTSPPMPEEIRKSLEIPRVKADSYYTAPVAFASPPMSTAYKYTAPPPAVSSPPMTSYGYSSPLSSDVPSIRIESINSPPKSYYN